MRSFNAYLTGFLVVSLSLTLPDPVYLVKHVPPVMFPPLPPGEDDLLGSLLPPVTDPVVIPDDEVGDSDLRPDLLG